MPDRNKPKVLMMLALQGVPGRGIARGVARYARLHGQWDFHRLPSFYQDTLSRGRKIILPPLEEWHADGIIANVNEPADAEQILASGIPAIVTYVRQPVPGLVNFISDNEEMGKIAAEYFLNKKYIHFAFCGFEGIHWSDTRLDGYRARLQQEGFAVNVFRQPISQKERMWENEQKYLAQWLLSLPKPVCILAASDYRAMDTIEACKIADLNVPEQVAVMGVDDDELTCLLIDPNITSIPQNCERAGYEAAELLDQMMKGEKVDKDKVILYANPIVERQSTDVMAINDEDVANAVRYIRFNATSIQSAEDVADYVCLSLRQLQKRFAKAIGVTISDEIRRVRMQKAASLLIETDLPISKIATLIGYDSYKNVAKSFRKEMGMSLIEYRTAFGRA